MSNATRNALIQSGNIKPSRVSNGKGVKKAPAFMSDVQRAKQKKAMAILERASHYN